MLTSVTTTMTAPAIPPDHSGRTERRAIAAATASGRNQVRAEDRVVGAGRREHGARPDDPPRAGATTARRATIRHGRRRSVGRRSSRRARRGPARAPWRRTTGARGASGGSCGRAGTCRRSAMTAATATRTPRRRRTMWAAAATAAIVRMKKTLSASAGSMNCASTRWTRKLALSPPRARSCIS